MSNAALLTLALLLDAFIGEPRWLWSRLPHPAVAMGWLIGRLDRSFNNGRGRKTKGLVSFAALVSAGAVFGWVITLLPFGWLIEIILTAFILAQRSLVEHVRAVASGLRISVEKGRHEVAKIVGRDTSAMTEADVARGAIESAAENLSDGVVAPAFWFLIAGLPGLLVYKITNTADSMIGYKTAQHKDFGWSAARFDDILNWVPARMTAVLISCAHMCFRGWANMKRDAALHRSPNAGWPEAAMAAALGIALSGPRSYSGEKKEFPFVNSNGRKDASAVDVDRSVYALWRAWALLVIFIAFLAIA